MMLYLLLTLAMIIAVVWFLHLALQEPGFVSIIYAGYSVEFTIVTLVIALILGFIIFTLLIWLLLRLLRWPRLFVEQRRRKLSLLASRGLVQGLIGLTEGRWAKAEKLLVRHAEYNEIPVLNYLGAARAAQMQGNYKKRDHYLREAIEHDPGANVAVGISQAEFQLSNGETEQAQATLERLSRLSPNHPYVVKLMAKVYYRLQNWEALYQLLPELSKESLLKKEERKRFEVATLAGLFKKDTNEGDLNRLKKRWKKLPIKVHNNIEAVILYCKAMLQLEDCLTCSDLIEKILLKQWDERLVEFYGKLKHDNVRSSIQKAEVWLLDHSESPMLLLTLARLHQQANLWGKSRHFFVASLNQAAHADAYLELAELLKQTGEKENAWLCFQQGLRFCIDKKSLPLQLKVSADIEQRLPQKTQGRHDDLHPV